MFLRCKYEPNKVGCSFILGKALKSGSCLVVPVCGTMALRKNGMHCTGDDFLGVVCGIDDKGSLSHNVAMAVTSDKKYADTKMLEAVPAPDMLMQLYKMCCQKHIASNNSFSLEVKSGKKILTLSYDSKRDMQIASVKEDGQCVLNSNDVTVAMATLSGGIELYGFSYSSISSKCEMSSTIRKDKIKVMKSISAYLGMTLIMISGICGAPGDVSIFLLSSTGCAQAGADLVIRKLPFTKAVAPSNGYVIGVENGIDSAIRGRSLSAFLGGMLNAEDR